MIATPRIDPSGSNYLLVGTGSVLAQWTAAIATLGRTALLCSFEEFPAALGAARAGTRIMIAGPEVEVMEAVSTAWKHGVLPCETITAPEHSEKITVFCPHCDSATTVVGEPGGTAQCSSCQRVLSVRPHTNARHGSYLSSI